jgi:hypothetical protein
MGQTAVLLHVTGYGVTLGDLFALSARDGAHDLLTRHLPALAPRQVRPVRSCVLLRKGGQQREAADRRSGLLRLLAADVQFPFRLPPVIVGAQLPSGRTPVNSPRRAKCRGSFCSLPAWLTMPSMKRPTPETMGPGYVLLGEVAERFAVARLPGDNYPERSLTLIDALYPPDHAVGVRHRTGSIARLVARTRNAARTVPVGV